MKSVTEENFGLFVEQKEEGEFYLLRHPQEVERVVKVWVEDFAI